MRSIGYKFLISLMVMTIWFVCCISMASATDVNPPQFLTKTDHSHDGQTRDIFAAAAESGPILSPSYLAPAQYIVIEVKPASGHSFSKGYGINNLSQIVGRTYNSNADTQAVEDQRALFWDLRTGSRALSTLDGHQR